MDQADKALAIVTGTFGILALMGFVALFIGRHLHKKVEALHREQRKSV